MTKITTEQHVYNIITCIGINAGIMKVLKSCELFGEKTILFKQIDTLQISSVHIFG